MRFLGVTETCDLGALYLRLRQEGYEVRIFIGEEKAKGTLAGLVPHSADWRAELDWVRAAGGDGIIIFEAVSEGYGALQDELRRDGFNVVGGSGFGDRLENDRAFAQRVLADAGLKTAGVREFSDRAAADAYLAEQPGRYVLKFSGSNAGGNYVGRMEDGSDVRAVLAGRLGSDERFILMDFLYGVEMGVGAFFDGEKFLLPACLDWEHKRFFAGDMGELTGEMGTVATFERSGLFFERTLKRLEPVLRGHDHRGWVNLNTIVNEAGIWPLELTCRFGYPGYAVLDPLQDIGWGELLRALTDGSRSAFPIVPGFSVGVVMTTPPFPYSRKEVDEAVGLPVLVPRDWGAEDLRHLHYGELGLASGQLVTSGLYGWTLVVTGVAATIEQARQDVYRRASAIVIPNGRYRLDIGERIAARDYARVEALGLLSDR